MVVSPRRQWFWTGWGGLLSWFSSIGGWRTGGARLCDGYCRWRRGWWWRSSCHSSCRRRDDDTGDVCRSNIIISIIACGGNLTTLSIHCHKTQTHMFYGIVIPFCKSNKHLLFIFKLFSSWGLKMSPQELLSHQIFSAIKFRKKIKGCHFTKDKHTHTNHHHMWRKRSPFSNTHHSPAALFTSLLVGVAFGLGVWCAGEETASPLTRWEGLNSLLADEVGGASVSGPPMALTGL